MYPSTFSPTLEPTLDPTLAPTDDQDTTISGEAVIALLSMVFTVYIFIRAVVLHKKDQSRKRASVACEDDSQDVYADSSIVPRRKVYVSSHIGRISHINTSEESFRAKFALSLMWPADAKISAAYEKYLDLRNTYQLPATFALSAECQFWRPSVTFPNAVEVHSMEWVSTAHDKRKTFVVKKQQTFVPKEQQVFEPEKADLVAENNQIYIRAVLMCDITFFEDFECENLPFDCQDLTIKIEGEKSENVPFAFEPDNIGVFDDMEFAMVDTDLSPITDTWDLVGMMINFFYAPSDRHRLDLELDGLRQFRPQCILSIKLARKWGVVMRNELLVIAMLVTLSLSVFAIEVEDFTDRLGQSLTLLLTTVLYDARTPQKSYRTLMDTYQLAVYGFMFAIMLTNMIEYLKEVDSPGHRGEMVTNFSVAFGMMHLYFFGLAMQSSHWEHEKVNMGYNQVQEHLKDHITRPKFKNLTNLHRRNPQTKSTIYYSKADHEEDDSHKNLIESIEIIDRRFSQFHHSTTGLARFCLEFGRLLARCFKFLWRLFKSKVSSCCKSIRACCKPICASCKSKVSACCNSIHELKPTDTDNDDDNDDDNNSSLQSVRVGGGGAELVGSSVNDESQESEPASTSTGTLLQTSNTQSSILTRSKSNKADDDVENDIKDEDELADDQRDERNERVEEEEKAGDERNERVEEEEKAGDERIERVEEEENAAIADERDEEEEKAAISDEDLFALLNVKMKTPQTDGSGGNMEMMEKLCAHLEKLCAAAFESKPANSTQSKDNEEQKHYDLDDESETLMLHDAQPAAPIGSTSESSAGDDAANDRENEEKMDYLPMDDDEDMVETTNATSANDKMELRSDAEHPTLEHKLVELLNEAQKLELTKAPQLETAELSERETELNRYGVAVLGEVRAILVKAQRSEADCASEDANKTKMLKCLWRDTKVQDSSEDESQEDKSESSSDDESQKDQSSTERDHDDDEEEEE